MFRDGNLLRRYSRDIRRDIRADGFDFPVGLHSALNVVINQSSFKPSVDQELRFSPLGTPIEATGPGGRRVTLFATDDRIDEKGMKAVLHNAEVLGIFNPVTKRFEAPPIQIKVHPQGSPAAPAE